MRSILTAAVCLSASAAAAQPGHTDQLRATLIAEHAHAEPGSTVHIGVHMALEDGWHTYWPGINATGFAAAFTLALPEGWTAGEPIWPAPERYVTSGGLGLDHVYHEDTTVIIPLRVPADAEPGATARVSADAEWLVCKDACIPGWATLTLDLPIRAAAAERSSDAGKFDRTRAHAPRRLPQPGSEPGAGIADGNEVAVERDGSALTIRARGAERVEFYPAAASATPADLIRAGSTRGSTLRLSFAPEQLTEKPIIGIVAAFGLGDRSPEEAVWFEIALPPAP